MSRFRDGSRLCGPVIAGATIASLLAGCGSAGRSPSGARSTAHETVHATQSGSDASSASVTGESVTSSAAPSSSNSKSPDSAAEKLRHGLNHHAAVLAGQLAAEVINAYQHTAPIHRLRSLQSNGTVILQVLPPTTTGEHGGREHYQLFVTIARYSGQLATSGPVVAVGVEADAMLAGNGQEAAGRQFTTVGTRFINQNGNWVVSSLGTSARDHWWVQGDFSQPPAPNTINTIAELDTISHQTQQFMADATAGRFIGYAEPPYAA